MTGQSYQSLMALALAMEHEATQRYEELADAMEVHNNRAVAELFRKMARIESLHAEQIMTSMGWSAPPPTPDTPAWPGFEAPETVPSDEIHYLMKPWHALQLALAAEQRAEAFFARMADTLDDEAARKAAIEFRDDERQHVALIRSWLENVPRPDEDWAHDPDPPRYDE